MEQSNHSHIKNLLDKSYSSHALINILNTFFGDINYIYAKMHSNDFYTYEICLIKQIPSDRSFYEERNHALLIERTYFPLRTIFNRNLGGKSDYTLLSVGDFMKNFDDITWKLWHIKMQEG